MNFDENELRQIEEWTDESPYITSYYAKIKHTGLGRLVLLKDFSHHHLQKRIEEQWATWDTLWKLEQYKTDREPKASYSHELADQMTALAKSNLRAMKALLQESLNTVMLLDWELLKDHSQFTETNPESALLTEIDLLPMPVEPLFKELPKEVNEDNFAPEIGFFDKLFPRRGRRKKEEAQTEYQKALALWEAELATIEAENRELRNGYLKRLAEAEQLKQTLTEHCEVQVNEWHRKFTEFTRIKNQHNQAIDQWKADFLNGKEAAVISYFDYILHYSAYPDLVSKIFQLNFIADEKVLLIDYQLPSSQKFPRVSEVRYIPPSGLLKDYELSGRQFSRVYDDAIYKMVLRTIYEVYETDTSGNVDSIVYNGWVPYVDDEQERMQCVISLRVSKDDFKRINLLYTDPKTCFEALHGRAGADLTRLEAVEPFVETGFARLTID